VVAAAAAPLPAATAVPENINVPPATAAIRSRSLRDMRPCFPYGSSFTLQALAGRTTRRAAGRASRYAIVGPESQDLASLGTPSGSLEGEIRFAVNCLPDWTCIGGEVPKFGHPTQPNRRRQTVGSRQRKVISPGTATKGEAEPTGRVRCRSVAAAAARWSRCRRPSSSRVTAPMSRSRVQAHFLGQDRRSPGGSEPVVVGERVQDVDVRTGAVHRTDQALPREAGARKRPGAGALRPVRPGNPATSERSFRRTAWVVAIPVASRRLFQRPASSGELAQPAADRHGQELGRLYRSGGLRQPMTDPVQKIAGQGDPAGPGPQVAGGLQAGGLQAGGRPAGRDLHRAPL